MKPQRSEAVLERPSNPKYRSASDDTVYRREHLFKKRSDSEADTSGLTTPKSSFVETASAALNFLHSASTPVTRTPETIPISSLEGLATLIHAERASEPNTFVYNGKMYRIKILPELTPVAPGPCEEGKGSFRIKKNLAGLSSSTSANIRKPCTAIQTSVLELNLSSSAANGANAAGQEKPRPLAFSHVLSLDIAVEPKTFRKDSELFPEYEELCGMAQPAEPVDPERQLHLAFLFAGPLVTACKDEGHVKIQSMASLKYDQEIEQILHNASDANQSIKYKKAVATLENFQQCMNEMPLALHFTGHGMKSTAFGDERANEGDFLVFEDERGKAQYVSCQKLKNILKGCTRQPEFVFVSSCHSRLVGDVFKAAGAKHVVCVKRSEQILDEVASMFAQAFYMAFFSSRVTVCAAFDVAKATVMAKTAEHDMQKNECAKFELLIGGDFEMPHCCSNICPIPVGQPVSTVPPVEYREIPSKVEHFVGRKFELYDIICLIHDARIVTIKGLPGIGKTSLAKTLAHFFLERGVFHDGIIYISARGVESTDALITQLYIASMSTTDTESLPSLPSTEKLICVVNTLQNKHLLLILDNAEDPLNKDKEHFLTTIHTLLGQIPKLKILVTSRTALGPLSDLTEKVYVLQPLDPKSSVLLLEKRAPRPILSSEIDELLKEELAAPTFPHNSSAVEQDCSSKFEEHELMRILAGHPQAISLAATLLQGRKLKEIYQELASNYCKPNEMHSLKVSLALSIEDAKSRNPDSVKFFKMMGLFPCGACSKEMETIWGPKYRENVNTLQCVSLLVRKETGDNQEDRYWLLPFMADYALNYLKDYDIDAVFQKGCQYYAEKLEAIFMTDCSSNNADNLIKDEPNILAFLGNGNGEGNMEDLEAESSSEPRSSDDIAAAKEQQTRELVLDSAGKEPVPSREAAELLGTEESKLSGCAKIPHQSLIRRRNSENSEELSLPPLNRQHSENIRTTSSSVVQKDRIRKMSLAGVEEEKRFYASHENVEAGGTTTGTGDEEPPSPKKKTAASAPQPKVVMRSYGKLLVYYCANLIMAHRYSDAQKTINNYINAPALGDDNLGKANLYKLLGLISDKMQDLEKLKDHARSKEFYCTAKGLFFKSGSYLGQAACLVALGEIERQEEEFEKAKWSYENALRNYILIGHKYAVVLCHTTLSLVKDRLGLKKQSKEHVIQARLVRESPSESGADCKNYLGGTFVSRWEGGPCAYIMEVAKEGCEIVADNKKRTGGRRDMQSKNLMKHPEHGPSKNRLLKTRSPERIEDIVLSLRQKNVRARKRTRNLHNATNFGNSGIFSIEEEESKEMPSEAKDNKLDIRDRKKMFLQSKQRAARDSLLKSRVKTTSAYEKPEKCKENRKEESAQRSKQTSNNHSKTSKIRSPQEQLSKTTNLKVKDESSKFKITKGKNDNKTAKVKSEETEDKKVFKGGFKGKIINNQ